MSNAILLLHRSSFRIYTYTESNEIVGINLYSSFVIVFKFKRVLMFLADKGKQRKCRKRKSIIMNVHCLISFFYLPKVNLFSSIFGVEEKSDSAPAPMNR